MKIAKKMFNLYLNKPCIKTLRKKDRKQKVLPVEVLPGVEVVLSSIASHLCEELRSNWSSKQLNRLDFLKNHQL